jgi:hypothetical protein
LSPPFNTSTLNGAPIGIAFAPGGDLFVCLDARYSGNGTDSVVRIDGQTGNFDGVVTTSNISIPQSLAFGSGGDFFVANQGSSTITRYAGTGAYLGTLVSGAGNPQGLYFLPDGDLAWGRGSSSFSRYDFASNQVPTFSSGYSFAHSLVLVPEPGFVFFVIAIVQLIARRNTRWATNP